MSNIHELSKEEKMKCIYQLLRSLQHDVSSEESMKWLNDTINPFELVMACESEELLEFVLQQKEKIKQRLEEWSES